MSEPLKDGEFELARHGFWWARVWRLESKRFPGRVLFFWSVGHDRVGEMWSGRGIDADAAAEAALAQFDRMTDLGESAS